MEQKKDSNCKRCGWVDLNSQLYIDYHDREWGVPVHDDRVHFEFLILEAAQAGLSWLTVLKRREGYRKAFANFDPAKVALYDEAKIEELLQDPGIIRNRLKVQAAVTNAKAFLEVQREFGSFDAYIWKFVGGQTIQNRWENSHQNPASSEESKHLSRDLLKRGFRFVGPTIIYAHMQATGLVNDHASDCWRYKQVMALSL